MLQTCHSCEPGAVLSHSMQHDTQIQTLNAADIDMNLRTYLMLQTCHKCKPGDVLSHTTQPDTQIQTMQRTLHVIAVNLGGMLSHTTQHDTQIQTLNATDIACHSCEPGGHDTSYYTTRYTNTDT